MHYSTGADVLIADAFRLTIGATPSVPEVERLSFDASGWQETERSSGWIQWLNQAGDVLAGAMTVS